MKEFIEIVNKPIVIKSNTLGTLKLRPVFDGDLNYLLKNINRGLDGESLCKKFIINQLSYPKLQIENLNDLNKSEIRNILEKYLRVFRIIDFFTKFINKSITNYTYTYKIYNYTK